MATKNVDWIAVEGAYRAGVDSLRTIGTQHGISEGMIRKKAKQQGWIRDAAGTKRAIVNAHMAVGAQNSTPEGTQYARETITDAANVDIQDMERGLESYPQPSGRVKPTGVAVCHYSSANRHRPVADSHIIRSEHPLVRGNHTVDIFLCRPEQWS
jgi:hypothetical protein